LRGGGWPSLPIPAAAEAWRARAAWLHAAELAACGSSSLPDLSSSQLLATLDAWLAPHLPGVRTKAQLQRLPWADVLGGLLPWDQRQRVEEHAPSHVLLPTGTRAAIDYSGPQPRARVKLQEVFGLADTPLLGGPRVRVPLLLELMSPAGRPLQARGGVRRRVCVCGGGGVVGRVAARAATGRHCSRALITAAAAAAAAAATKRTC
jgi:ATP-dependent helicase HrpB